MLKPLLFAVGLAAAGSTAFLHVSPALAQTPATGANVDCTKAGAMMMQAQKMHSMSAPAMSGDVDKDYRAMSMMHDKATMMMAQVEVSCGKDDATKAAAGRVLQDSQQRLEMFRNQGQS